MLDVLHWGLRHNPLCERFPSRFAVPCGYSMQASLLRIYSAGFADDLKVFKGHHDGGSASAGAASKLSTTGCSTSDVLCTDALTPESRLPLWPPGSAFRVVYLGRVHRCAHCPRWMRTLCTTPRMEHLRLCL